MRPANVVVVLVLALCGACVGENDGGGGEGDGMGNGGSNSTHFPGLWQYEEGSYTFVNCFSDSRTVDLTGSGFRIDQETGMLVRVSTDGCRVILQPTTELHAQAPVGQECTVTGTDPSGVPYTTRLRLDQMLLDIEPGSFSKMVEVFQITGTTTTTLGSFTCESTGNNTLVRVP